MLDFDFNALYEALKDVCVLTNTTITLYDDNKNSLFSYKPYPCTLCQKIHIIKVISGKCKRCDKEAIDKASKSLDIKEAKRLLFCSLSITQVAEAVGMSDSNYFIKIFKKETGYTPLKYKKTLKDCT